MLGYAYILTHPGVPCVFYDHFFDWGLGEGIKELIQVKRDGDTGSPQWVHCGENTRGILVVRSDAAVATCSTLLTVISPRGDCSEQDSHGVHEA